MTDVQEYVLNAIKLYTSSKKTVSLDSTLKDELGLDSLDAVELAINIEEEFGIMLDDKYIAQCKTVQDIIDLTKKEIG